MPKIIQSSGLMRMAFLYFVDLGSDFMDCTSWTWLPLLFNIPGWPLKAGLLLGFPHLQARTVEDVVQDLKKITTSAASSSTLGMASIMISSSSLGLPELFWAVLPSSLLTSAAAPGTLRLKKKVSGSKPKP